MLDERFASLARRCGPARADTAGPAPPVRALAGGERTGRDRLAGVGWRQARRNKYNPDVGRWPRTAALNGRQAAAAGRVSRQGDR
jgi:hypothetical protein